MNYCVEKSVILGNKDNNLISNYVIIVTKHEMENGTVRM